MPELASHTTWSEPPAARGVAIALSLLGHALLIGLLLLAGRAVVPQKDDEPVRLVFTEPAPPPRLGVPDAAPGGSASNGAIAPAAPAAEPVPPEPPSAAVPHAAREAVEHPTAPARHAALIASPKQVHRAAPVERPSEHVSEQPAEQPAEASAGAPSSAPTGASARSGSADGIEAGAEGGLPGGRVGGLGTELISASRAAVPPTVVHRVMPAYPESARARGVEGQVVIEAVIARDGRVEENVRIVQSIPELDEAAIDAFRKWQFTPARDASGAPIRVLLQAPVRFVLR